MVDPILIELPAVIETERLRLRSPQAGDGAALYLAIQESLPDLRRFLASVPWVATEQSIDASEIYCRNAAANFLTRKDMPFLLFEKSTGEIVGATGLHRAVWATPKFEVGYWGRSSKSGQGLITEAVKAVTELALGPLAAVRVELITDAENHASRRLAERCGYTLEGTLRSERRAPDGSLRDICMYARVAAPT